MSWGIRGQGEDIRPFDKSDTIPSKELSSEAKKSLSNLNAAINLAKSSRSTDISTKMFDSISISNYVPSEAAIKNALGN